MSSAALELEAARLQLGLTRGYQLVRVARAGLRCGLDSPSLARLAEQSDAVLSKAAPLFLSALDELGLAVPTREQAYRLVVHDLKVRMARG